MKKSIIFCFLAALFAIAATSCKDDEKTLVSIEVTKQPAKTIYTVGDPFDAAGMAVSAKFSDGSTAPVTVTADMLSYDFTEAGENKTVTISYAYEGKTETASVDGIRVKAVDLPFTGVGTEETPFQINTTEQFMEFVEFVNDVNSKGEEVYFKQTSDINLKGASKSFLKANTDWVPIGTKENPFTGNYDGMGFKITGLYVNDVYAPEDTVFNAGGLFGYISGGTVMNATVEGTVIGNYSVGGVAGSLVNGGSIINCHANVEITADGAAGGIVGTVMGGSAVKNCTSTGSVTGGGGIAGLVIGSGSSVTNCSSSCTINGGGGGVAGTVLDGASLSNCYATGDVIGGGTSGGVVGNVYSAHVSNCYATGAVSGSREVGGVAGLVQWNSSASGSLTGCVALNPSITLVGANNEYARISRIGTYNSNNSTNYLTNNAAYSGMTVDGANVGNFNASNENGADMTKATIQAGGTLGNRFTSAGGWTTGAGSLPGFGATVELPAHLR